MQEASLSAQEVAIKVSMETGSWSLSDSPEYARQWMNDVPAEPRISVTATGGGGYASTDIRGKVIPKSANNMYNPDNNEIHFYSGLGTNNYTLSYTYQIAAQVGWRIVGASLQFTSSSDDIGVAVSLNGSKTVASENTGDIQSVDVYGLNKPIVDMQVSSLGTNNVFVVAKELTITLEPEPEYVLAELKNKAITVGTAVTEFRANTWYLLYQARINGPDHDEVLQPGEKPGMGGYMWNPGEGGDFFPRKMAATELESNPIITDEYYANALVRFIPTESGDDTYKIQFGGDRWLTTIDGFLWADWILSFENLTEFNIYAIDKEANPAAFGINVAPYSQRVNNNGNGGLIVLWDTGKQDNVAYNNGIWNIVSVELTDASLKDIAYQNLKHTYNEYISYYDSFTSGILPGQYGIDEVAAFRAALDKVAELETSGIGEITTEELEHLAEQIEETYEAVINSHVELSMPNGYYRIKTGLDYEDGEDKYMYVSDEGGTLNGMWGSVAKLDSHAPSLWKLTDKGNGLFELKNVTFDAQFNRSSPFTLQTDSRELLYIIPSAYEDDRIYMNMRVATQTGAYTWIHQGGHGGGAGTGGNLVAWSADEGSSEWLFVPVSEEDAAAIIEAYKPVREREKFLAIYDSIMTDAKANLELARDIQKIVHNEEGEELITSDSQFSSPYTEPTEGTDEELQAGSLRDNDNTTYWHSKWTDGDVEMDYHYLQVEINDVDVQSAVAVIGRRNVSNDHVTIMNVRGTNDSNADKTSCTLLGSIRTPFEASGEMGVVSDVFDIKGYKYLRFYPTTTTNNRGYFHLAEFQLYPAELYQSEDALCFKLGELFTNLEAVVNAQKDMERDDIQEEHYNILKAAYDAFMEGVENEIMKNEAYQNLLKVYDTYYVYYDAFTAGMNSGRYSEAKVAAFRIALDAVTALDGNLDGLTVDDLNRMAEHIRETYEAALKGTDAWNSAYRNLMEVYDTYYVYYNSFTPGTNPGNYGETEVIAFRAALDDVAGLGAPDANLDGFTVEDLNRMGVRIKEAYEAVIDSYINAPLSTPVISRGTNNTIRISGSEGTDSENPPTYYYTLNGTTPTTSSSRYLGPVTVTRNLTVKAIATREGYPQSDVAEFSVDWFKVAMPTFEPADNICTISCPTADATIYYTLDGTTPTEKSTRYTSPITVTKNLTLKAIAVHDGYNPSDVAELVVDWFQVAKPSFAQQGNQLSISCATEQATIYYTIGGSKEQVYNSAITLSDQSTVTAVGRREGYRDSETATYRPGLVKSATPVVTYNGREVRLENEEEGVHIYYTLDGTSPIDGEKKSNTAMEYFGVFNVDTLCLLRAVSVTDMTNVSDELTYKIDYLFDGTTAYVGQGGLLEKAFEWCGGMNVIDDRLTVSGPLNDAELRTISKLPALEYLDLGKATLTSGRMPNELFRGTGLVSFVSPYGFSDTGGRLFADCPKLAAVIWNVNVALDANSFDGVDNPNLLLYVKDKKYAPASVTNVVIDGMAEHIVLTDKESGNNDFYCPKSFFAENISYTHDYRMQTKEGTTCGWETIALPFTVQSVTHEKNGALQPFFAEGDGKPFWLLELSQGGLEAATKIEAYHPYLISMPNSPHYVEDYRQGGLVTFAASDVEIAPNEVKSVEGAGVILVPALQRVAKSNSVYAINRNAPYDVYAEGSVFVAGSREVRPFEAYTLHLANANNRVVTLRDLMDDVALGVFTIPLTEYTDSLVRVYTLSGVLIAVGEHDEVMKRLPKGVYIINGRKILK